MMSLTIFPSCRESYVRSINSNVSLSLERISCEWGRGGGESQDNGKELNEASSKHICASAPTYPVCKCMQMRLLEGGGTVFVNMMLVSKQIASKICSHLEYFHRLSVLIRRPQHVIFYRCLVRAHVRMSECQRRRGRKASVRACTCIETRSWPLKTRATVKRCAAR